MTVQWRYEEVSGRLAGVMENPRRDLAIAWDGADRSLFLSVNVAPTPNVEGSQARAYVAPVSLLAALVIVPADLHGALVDLTRDGRVEAEALVLGELAGVVNHVPQGWPATAKATEGVRAAERLVEQLERLSLDLAAAAAFRDEVGV